MKMTIITTCKTLLSCVYTIKYRPNEFRMHLGMWVYACAHFYLCVLVCLQNIEARHGRLYNIYATLYTIRFYMLQVKVQLINKIVNYAKINHCPYT